MIHRIVTVHLACTVIKESLLAERFYQLKWFRHSVSSDQLQFSHLNMVPCGLNPWISIGICMLACVRACHCKGKKGARRMATTIGGTCTSDTCNISTTQRQMCVHESEREGKIETKERQKHIKSVPRTPYIVWRHYMRLTGSLKTCKMNVAMVPKTPTKRLAETRKTNAVLGTWKTNVAGYMSGVMDHLNASTNIGRGKIKKKRHIMVLCNLKCAGHVG